MRSGFGILAVLLAGLAQAADPVPAFTPAGVWPGGESAVVSPGSIMSIYGNHLGPASQCIAQADPALRETVNPRNPYPQFANLSVYPPELCGVQVLIRGQPAGMLYASSGQINFKVPQDSPEIGMVDLRVVSQGESSAAVLVKAGFGGGISLSLAEPAYTGMPVWLKVNPEYPLGMT